MKTSPSAVRRRTWTWIWVGYWLTIFVLTHVPLRGVRLPVEGGDKVIHVLSYFGLALLGGRAAVQRGVVVGGGWLTQWMAVYVLYAAADEFLQRFVNRSCSLSDWAADVVGAAAGLLVIYVNRRAFRVTSDPDPSA